MSKHNSNNFTPEWFESKGYVKNKSGGYDPPKFKDPFGGRIKPLIIVQGKFTPETIYDGDHYQTTKEGHIIPKQKINNSPDFEVKVPTEWFITYSVPSKKNSRQNFVRNGKQVSIPSKSHAEYVKVTAMQYKVFGVEFRNAVDFYKVSYPLYVEFKFVRSTRHRFDFCNACQGCEDIMVSNNWIKDDSADYLIPVFVPYEYDKNNPGVRIRLIIDK